MFTVGQDTELPDHLGDVLSQLLLQNLELVTRYWLLMQFPMPCP